MKAENHCANRILDSNRNFQNCLVSTLLPTEAFVSLVGFGHKPLHHSLYLMRLSTECETVPILTIPYGVSTEYLSQKMVTPEQGPENYPWRKIWTRTCFLTIRNVYSHARPFV